MGAYLSDIAYQFFMTVFSRKALKLLIYIVNYNYHTWFLHFYGTFL